MGSIASKKNERFQINYFLFENYKKHIKFDTNFLEAELLPSQLESISYEETPSCFCYNVCVESIVFL